MEQPKLKPCPHCGGQAVYGEAEGDRALSSWVICNGCGCGAHSSDTQPEKTPVSAWNARIDKPGAPG